MRRILLLPLLTLGLLACGGAGDDASPATAAPGGAAGSAAASGEAGGGGGVGATGEGLCRFVADADMAVLAPGADLAEPASSSVGCQWGARNGSARVEIQDLGGMGESYDQIKERVAATASGEAFRELDGIGDAALIESYLSTAGNLNIVLSTGDRLIGVYYTGQPADTDGVEATMLAIAGRVADGA
jgi:hypothetical protein